MSEYPAIIIDINIFICIHTHCLQLQRIYEEMDIITIYRDIEGKNIENVNILMSL